MAESSIRVSKFGKLSAKGSWTIIGGTGEYQGITGGGESEGISLRSAAKGTFQGYEQTQGKLEIAYSGVLSAN